MGRTQLCPCIDSEVSYLSQHLYVREIIRNLKVWSLAKIFRDLNRSFKKVEQQRNTPTDVGCGLAGVRELSDSSLISAMQRQAYEPLWRATQVIFCCSLNISQGQDLNSPVSPSKINAFPISLCPFTNTLTPQLTWAQNLKDIHLFHSPMYWADSLVESQKPPPWGVLPAMAAECSRAQGSAAMRWTKQPKGWAWPPPVCPITYQGETAFYFFRMIERDMCTSFLMRRKLHQCLLSLSLTNKKWFSWEQIP